jgi:hypothetical protein
MNIGYDYYNESDPVNLPPAAGNARLNKEQQSTYDLVRASVTEFHEKTGQYIGQEQGDSPPLSVDTMRQNLIDEETAELLKEICDLAYVLAGADVEWNDTGSKRGIATLEMICNVLALDFRTAFQRVHEDNLGRIIQDDGTIKRREDGKIIKNPNAPKIDLGDLV